MADNEFLTDRIKYIKGLKSPSEQQSLLVTLAEMPERTASDDRKLAALLKAEKAQLRALRARSEVQRLVNAEKEAARKARNHQLFEVAGLLSLAGLLDKTTGKPLTDRGELLGALLAIAETPADDPRRASWKRKGDALLAGGA
jgi:hypothetical protein